VDDLQVRKGGKAIRKWRAHLNNVKTVCDVLKVTPEQLIASRQIAEDFTKSFVLEWRKEHTTSPREYIMALRNYAMDAGIVWARGVNGIMSGKKEGFGKYAGVKMTEDQINNAIDLAWAMGELDTAYWIAIGKETCARHHALEEIRIDTLEECGDYLTLKAFESKTQKTWVKYIVDPAVQALVRTRIANRQTSGKSTMFDPNDGDKVNKVLKTIYGKLGLTDPYFQQHPTHALRHVGAHHWLRITGYNYALVAKIGGWDDVGTLIKCYGEMPGDVLIAELHRARAAI
jgi:integrase